MSGERRGFVPTLAQYAVVLLTALTLNFALPRLAPGDPLEFLIGAEFGTFTPADRARVAREVGLDAPVHVQYGRYLAGIARGDLGRSIRSGEPVASVLGDRLRWTVLLLVPSLLLSVTVGTLLGTLAAWKRARGNDVSLLTAALILDALPVFWIGMVLIAVFSTYLGWLPSFGAVPLFASAERSVLAAEVARRLVLPITTLTLAGVGHSFLVARGAMLTTLGDDYVAMAEAKGVPERTIILHHALRNALLPVVTNLALGAGAIVGGAVLVETVYALPGLGRLIFEAVGARDYPLLQGAFLLVVVGVLGANALADLAYRALDPRTARSGRS